MHFLHHNNMTCRLLRVVTNSLIPILWTQEFILHYLPSIRCNISQSVFIFGFHRTDTVVFQRIVSLCCCGNIQSSSIIMKGVCCCLSDNVPQFTYNRGKGTRQMLVVTKLPLRYNGYNESNTYKNVMWHREEDSLSTCLPWIKSSTF